MRMKFISSEGERSDQKSGRLLWERRIERARGKGKRDGGLVRLLHV
jgi:hypothetical protein